MTPCASTKRAPNCLRAQASTGSHAADCFSLRAGRRIGAIAQQIRAEIFRDLVCDRLPAHRGRASITALASRVSGIRAGSITSFCVSHSAAMASASATRRRGQRAPRRRLHRFAVEQYLDRTALRRIGDLRAFVEALAQVRPRRPARRFRRVERLIFENLGKNLAHWDSICAAQNKRNSTPRC